MSEQKKQIQIPLVDFKQKIEPNPEVTASPPAEIQYQYKQFGNQPKVKISGLKLIVLCPLLIVAHLRACAYVEIPLIQFAFVSTLVAFLINYTMVIRKYQLMPYLPEELYDGKLKRICVYSVIGLIVSMIWGWNGSGGILYAVVWEYCRGNRIQFYGYLFVIVIIGSLMMEENFYWKKLIQFIPGLLFGLINSTLFTLRQSSYYAIAHQFLLIFAITVPILFPAFHIVVPSLLQWVFMIVSGISILFTIILIINLMQNERVSVVMAVMSGVLMIGTSTFGTTYDFLGALIILVGVGAILKKQYIDIN